jgi:hypothetical protein
MSATGREGTVPLRETETWQHAARQSFAAVCALALDPGPLQERLEGACDALLGLESREIPAPLREEFGTLIAALTAIDDLPTLSDDAAATLARRMLAFHERVLLL